MYKRQDEGFSCGSGDNFVNNKIEMNVDLVDMEAYALAKVCKLENVNFRCFKFISDNADESASLDWKENCKKGAELFKQKTAYEIMPSLVGSEMCIRDSSKVFYLCQ